jgi:CheY-like chemotaxis protein
LRGSNERPRGYRTGVEASPELIILDLAMPVMNGLDAARELKKLLPSVPIILFTQYADFGNALADDRKNVDRVVSKTKVEELIAHVRELLPVY